MPCERPIVRYQRYQSLQELRPECLHDDEAWLTAPERAELATLTDAVRRQAWLWGRFLTKKLIVEAFPDEVGGFQNVEVCSRDASGRVVRPRLRIDGNSEKPWCLSLSHTGQAVLVALCLSADMTVGVDLAAAESLPEGFLSIWFTERERDWLSDVEPEQTAVCWAIKEAVYKACNRGESFAPRRIEVFPGLAGNYSCRYDGWELPQECRIETWQPDGHVAAMATMPRSVQPGNRRVRGTRPRRGTIQVGQTAPPMS